jgi:tetratricopeptide (TPR) repeat protein
MLLDRRRVKFWQRIVFGFMAFLMAAFLVVGYSGVLEGCSFGGEQVSATDVINKEIAAQEAAVAAAPKDAQEWAQLGELYVERGNMQPLGSAAQTTDWDKAAAAYTRADRLLAKEKGQDVKQQRLDVLTKLVDVQLFLEDYAGATSTYGVITGLTPKDAQTFFEMASVAVNAGDTGTALLAFGRFLELDPDSPDAPAVEEWIEQNSPSSSPSPTE